MDKTGPSKIKSVLRKVRGQLAESADVLVPWFYENMPEYYFRTHSEQEQIRHLHAMLSTRVKTERQGVVLKSPCGTRITQIMPGGDMGALVQSLASLQREHIQTARIYSSFDRAIRLDTYLLGDQPKCSVRSKGFKTALDLAEELRFGGQDVDAKRADEFSSFLSTATNDYVDKFEPARALRHFELCRCMEGTERVHVRIEDTGNDDWRIIVGMRNPPRSGLLLQAVKVFSREGVDLKRAYGDEFQRGRGNVMAVMSFYVPKDSGIAPGKERWRRIKRQLKLIKWFAFHGLERFAEEEGWELSQVMLMQAACEFAHQFLIRQNIYAYTSNKIVRTVLRHREAAKRMLAYFETRFDPDFPKRGKAGEDEMAKCRNAVNESLRDLTDDIERKILATIYRFFRYILRTNYYMPEHFGLSFRMDPAILSRIDDEERPYAFYCFHGPNSFAFHVRYRDMARGGLRVVRTWTQEHFELESNRLFDEATKLASAQQFKNKDIPEGGSKAVLLLGPSGDIDLAVKSMVDSFLDLLIVDEEGRLPKEIVDYLGREEIIYLGPDENITAEHIQWIAARAERRGYRWPSAFMSSKPDAGVNHKEYGVTSEGVVVYAHEVLRYLGIDPDKQAFTVKLTGGPAGDVASNAVRFLIRNFGKNARILSMSDGHGAMYDPEGLDHGELKRLIRKELRCDAFDPAKIRGEGGFVVSSDTPEGARIRDGLHNTVQADLFIPAGGRPETINTRNWPKFLNEQGKPSAKAMVEGANIFIHPDARRRLEKKGLLAVPGSSANKTGVICSSYEILAGLVLSEAEFKKIKKDYVHELLDILRRRARDEAGLLLREYALAAGERTVTDISLQLSRSINALGDTVAKVLDQTVGTVAEDETLVRIIREYCPPVLAREYGQRLLERIPRAHQIALLGAHISSSIMYREGLGWVERLMKVRGVREVVYAYLEEERHLDQLLRQVERSTIRGKRQVARILEQAGRRRLTLERLDLD